MLKQILSAIVFGILSIPVSAETVAVTGGTVFKAPDSTPIENGTIIFTDGAITGVGPAADMAIPNEAKIVDAAGRFVTAGFWNAHVHYTGPLEKAADGPPEELQRRLTHYFLRWGFVSTVDTGSYLGNTLKIKARIESGDVAGPKIIAMSGSFVPKNGSPFYIKPIQLPAFTNKNAIPAMTKGVLAQGADGIKIFSGSWSTPETVVVMRPEHVEAVVNTAHGLDAMVIAHPSDSAGARVAIENGVDILAHTFPSEIKGPWDKSLIEKMVARQIALVPTLKLFRVELTKVGLPDNIVDRVEAIAVEQTALAHKAGVQILFGTDVGYMNDVDTSAEFELMARAGLDYRAILASLTTAPAQRFGYSETDGEIKSGNKADLVVLGSDPRQAISAFSDVHTVYRDGRVVFEKSAD